ncbi:MAG: type VII secretion target [Actinophytocola sp.]|uniref:type VII secretion target n=1 Tax=Actinophytocola sp. TaxID=1872138 RepID=UPI003D6B9D12
MAPRDEVRVVCEKLREDATRWDTASDAMGTASRASEGLELGPARLGYVAQERGLIAAYDAIKQKLTTLLGGGEAEFDVLATKLREIADNYERTDSLGADAILRAGGG